MLLDSDCVPVTLFEVEDLWREAQRLQHSGFPGRRIPLNGVSQEPVLHEYIERVVAAYWEVVSTMVSNGRDDRDMTPAECQAWIQTGLALAPFCGHRMDTSLDWAVAWSLVGEWTSRTIFLPPQGEWPRQGHTI